MGGWSDIKYLCGTAGHEVTEGIADVDVTSGWRISEPFSDPTGNNELCDFCNKQGAENQTFGSGIGGEGPNQPGGGGISSGSAWIQDYTGYATFGSTNTYACTYWDDNGGGCRAPGTDDGNRTRPKANKILTPQGGGPAVFKNAKLIFIFWGSQWDSQMSGSSLTRDRVTRNFQRLSDQHKIYYSSLSQYSNINPPTFLMSVTYKDPNYTPIDEYFMFSKALDPRGNPNDRKSISQVVLNCIAQGLVPAPNWKGAGTNDELYYVVFAPQGMLIQDTANNGGGAHTWMKLQVTNKFDDGTGGANTAVPCTTTPTTLTPFPVTAQSFAGVYRVGWQKTGATATTNAFKKTVTLEGYRVNPVTTLAENSVISYKMRWFFSTDVDTEATVWIQGDYFCPPANSGDQFIPKFRCQFNTPSLNIENNFSLEVVIGHTYVIEMKLINSDHDMQFTITDQTSGSSEPFTANGGGAVYAGRTTAFADELHWTHYACNVSDTPSNITTADKLDWVPFVYGVKSFASSTDHGTTYTEIGALTKYSDGGFSAYPVGCYHITSGTFSDNTTGILCPSGFGYDPTIFLCKEGLDGGTCGGKTCPSGQHLDSNCNCVNNDPGTDPNKDSEDPNGVRKLFTTLAGSETKDWFMPSITTNLPADARVKFNDGATAAVTAGSSNVTITPASTPSTNLEHGVPTFDWRVFPDSDQTTATITDHSVMRSQGFMKKGNDWKAVEMTAYYFIDAKATNFTQKMACFMAARSGSHNLTGSAPCSGTGYFVGIEETGDGKVWKEYKHAAARFSPTWDSAFTRHGAETTGGGGGCTNVLTCPAGQMWDSVQCKCVNTTACDSTLSPFDAIGASEFGDWWAGWDALPSASSAGGTTWSLFATTNAISDKIAIEKDCGNFVPTTAPPPPGTSIDKGDSRVRYALDWILGTSTVLYPFGLSLSSYRNPPSSEATDNGSSPTKNVFTAEAGFGVKHFFNNIPVVVGHTYKREIKLFTTKTDFIVTDLTTNATETYHYTGAATPDPFPLGNTGFDDCIFNGIEWLDLSTAGLAGSTVPFMPSFDVAVTEFGYSSNSGTSYNAFPDLSQVKVGYLPAVAIPGTSTDGNFPMAGFSLQTGSVTKTTSATGSSIEAVAAAIAGSQIYKAKPGGKIYTRMNQTGSQGASDGIRWNFEYDDCHVYDRETTWICSFDNGITTDKPWWSPKIGSHDDNDSTLVEASFNYSGSFKSIRTESPHGSYNNCSGGHHVEIPDHSCCTNKPLGFKTAVYRTTHSSIMFEWWIDWQNAGAGPWTKLAWIDWGGDGSCSPRNGNGLSSGCWPGDPSGGLQDTWRANGARSTFTSGQIIEIMQGGVLNDGTTPPPGGCTGTCPTGQHMDESCHCVPDSGGGCGTKTCSPGRHLDENCNCVNDTPPPPPTPVHPGPIIQKWIGQKVLISTDTSGNVVQDVYYDGPYDSEPTTPPNNWTWYYTIPDNGTNFGALGDTSAATDGCKAANTGEIITWGGPEAIFNFIGMQTAKIKWLSVREIDTTKPMPWQGGTHPCPAGQHFDSGLQICVDDTGGPPSTTKHRSSLRVVWNEGIDLSDKCFGGFEGG